jgi:hypothetical protein
MQSCNWIYRFVWERKLIFRLKKKDEVVSNTELRSKLQRHQDTGFDVFVIYSSYTTSLKMVTVCDRNI